MQAGAFLNSRTIEALPIRSLSFFYVVVIVKCPFILSFLYALQSFLRSTSFSFLYQHSSLSHSFTVAGLFTAAVAVIGTLIVATTEWA